MKHFSVLVALLAFAAVTPAQTPIRQEVFYDFTAHASQAVISTPVGKLTGLFGKPDWSLDISSFIGVESRGTGLIGTAATTNFRIADQLSLFAGPAGIITQGQKPRIGLLVGFSFRQ